MTFRNSYIVLLSTVVLTIQNLKAQDNWMMQWQGIQQTYINPAYTSQKSWEISVASTSLDFQLGNLNAGDFIEKNTAGVNVISLDRLASAIDGKSDLMATGQFNTFDLVHRIGSITFSAGHGINYEFSTSLNPTLIDIMANGNAAYIGKTVELGMPASASVYQRYYLGAAIKTGPVNIGVRAAYLNGWHHMHTERLSSQLTTGADYYELTIANDIEIYNAGIFEYRGIDDIETIKGINDYKSLFTANHGMAFDLGMELKLSENSGIFVSAQNLGTIKWADRAQKLTNNTTTILKGIDIEKVIDGEEDASIEDTLLSVFSLKQENLEFSQKVAARYNAGGYFSLAGTTFSALFNFKDLSNIQKASVYLQASRPILSWLDLGVNYQWRSDAAFNLGVMAKTEFGPVVIFGVCNNAWSLLNPSRLDGLSGRVGAYVGF
ncbi:MAG: hypothetical protein KA340_06490 [Saprospiraceae bacterium]|nr:hypothetical protein [Saprospiraceae bacterium]